MPIYEYECASCGQRLEQIHLVAEVAPAAVDCTCGKTATRVQFSVGNWQFGTGQSKGSPVSEAIKRVKARGL